MPRKACCPKEGINRGAWTSHEDKLLTDYIAVHGLGKWGSMPKNAGLKRCGKSCRLRWLNYLRPDIKRGNMTEDEEALIIRLHKLLGNRWSLIAGRIPGRTDNEIKNYWNTCLRKKLSGETPKQRGRVRPVKEEVSVPVTEKPVDIIKTKAVRCTKILLPDQSRPPDYSKSNLLPTSLPNAAVPVNSSEQEGSSSSLMEVGFTEFEMSEIIGDLSLVQPCGQNLMCGYGSFTTADDDYFMGIYNYDVDQGISPCSEDAMWGTFPLQKI